MLEDETLYAVPAAVERVTGQRPSPATCHRWRLRGVKNVRLETCRVGGRRKTSVEAVRRFIEATTRAADGDQPAIQSRTNRQREASINRAERELEEAGI